jgi:hypothetical protein
MYLSDFSCVESASAMNTLIGERNESCIFPASMSVAVGMYHVLYKRTICQESCAADFIAFL